jgi:hypothetical protein
MLVYHRRAEKENFIVRTRKNVSQVELLVKLLIPVKTMASVVVMRVVSVLTVLMVVQMIRINVASSDECKPSVAMMTVAIINQVRVVFLQNDGTQKQMVG